MPFKDHDCDEFLEVRERGVSFVWQCLFCGEQRGGALKKKDYLQSGGEHPKEFDKSISDEYYKKKDMHYEECKKARASFNPERDKAIVQLNKAFDVLITHEGLKHGINSAQVILNKYKRKRFYDGLESLDRFSSEIELKQWLEKQLSRDFHFIKEVDGTHLAEDKGVRIDYLFKAKPYLIKQGFTPNVFGVEVKYIPQDKGFTRKLSRAFWQTISYNDCQFEVDGKICKPQFCLLFSNLSFMEERKWLTDFDGFHSSDYAELSITENIANHARVGTLAIKGVKKSFKGWIIKFSGTNYFTCSLIKGQWQYRMANKAIINKVRIGNF